MNNKLVSHAQRGNVSATVIICVALLVAYVLTWILFLGEGHPKMVLKGGAEKGVHIQAHVIAVDLVKDSISMTLVPDVASPALASGRKLTADVDVEIDTGISVLSHKFKKGDAPIPWVASIPIQDGDLTEYPVDNYTGAFSIKAGLNGGAKSPAYIDIDKIVHGFRFSAAGEPASDNSELEVEFRLARAPSVVFLSVMAMLSMTVVVLSALNVAWQVATKERKLEFGMIIWSAALLFVIPSVRSGMPGSPPPGSMIDAGLFFWLHVLTVIAVVTLVARWSRDGK